MDSGEQRHTIRLKRSLDTCRARVSCNYVISIVLRHPIRAMRARSSGAKMMRWIWRYIGSRGLAALRLTRPRSPVGWFKVVYTRERTVRVILIIARKNIYNIHFPFDFNFQLQ